MNSQKSQPKYNRQRFLLSFIRQLQQAISLVDLHLLVFLNLFESTEPDYFFLPGPSGPYSHQLEEDLEILERDNFSEVKGESIVAVGDFDPVTEHDINALRGTELVRFVLLAHPFYAINATAVASLFSASELKDFAAEKARYQKTEQVLFSIGYEGRSVEEFCNILLQNDVRLIVDVRNNPFSRKFGFAKKRFSEIVESLGLGYIHMPELGIEHAKRETTTTDEEFQALFAEYAKTLPERQEALDHVYALLQENKRIALLCYEHEPIRCHRHVISDYLQKTKDVVVVAL